MFKQNYYRDKNFILLFFGSLVSGIGSRMYGFGISLFLLDLTGSASSMATYFSIWIFVLFVLSPIAATFTDRWKNKVKVLYITDFGRGIIYLISALGIYYFNSLGNIQLVLTTIYVILVFIGIQTAFFSPTSSALLPQLVHEDELVSASGLYNLTRSLQNILGLALGAIIYATFGIIVLIIINAISFILSAISEMFIKYEKAKNQERLDESAYEEEEINGNNKFIHYFKRVLKDLKDATTYIFTDAKPIAAIIFLMIINMSMVSPYFSIGIPYIIKEHLSFDNFKPDYILATSETAVSIGLIFMSFMLTSFLATKLKIYQLLRLSAVVFIIFAISSCIAIKFYDINFIEENIFIVIFLIISFISGIGNALINVPLSASISKYVDPNKIGKVVTLMDSFGGILMPVSFLLLGLLIDEVSMYIVLYVMLAGFSLQALIIYKNKHISTLK